VQVDGVSIIKDKEVTGFTNAEEGVMNKYEAVSQPSGPGSCEDAMTAAGGAHTFPQSEMRVARVIVPRSRRWVCSERRSPSPPPPAVCLQLQEAWDINGSGEK